MIEKCLSYGFPNQKKEIIDEERKRIDNLMDIQNWPTFAAGRIAYTGSMLSAADKSDLQQRYHARMIAARGFFFQALRVVRPADTSAYLLCGSTMKSDNCRRRC